ncbi:MAG: transglycosylase domain-containing protein [Deltaproteobacteria bacterium]|nr:transglycosylase domain-containing protein [Deltaproteobacteria bacterium]
MKPSGTTTRKRPRWVIPAAVLAAVCVLVTVLLLVVYPRVGEWMIRGKVGDRLATKLGRDVHFGAIDVSLGHATLRDLVIRGPHDGDTPLIHIDRLDIEFDTMRSLVGSVKLGEASIDGIVITVRRDAAGKDNLGDLVERVLEKRDGSESSEGGGGLRPTSLTVTHARILIDDAVTGATGLVADASATWKPGELTAQARQVSATTLGAPKATANLVEVTKKSGQPPMIRIEGGELAVWPKLALSGIDGTVVANPAKQGEYTLELAGGYGGVPGKLWTAKGAVDLEAVTMNIDLVAAKFQLDKLAPLLEKTPVVDYAGTSVDANLHLAADRSGGKFSGALTLRGLNVGHPLIAAKEVHGLDLSAQVEGSFDRASQLLELRRGDFIVRDLPFSMTGSVTRVASATGEVQLDPQTGQPIARRGPAGINTLKARLVIPSVDCQRVLNAIPVEMAPYLVGYKLSGMFDTDVTLDIDWANLDATKLDGRVGIRQCRVRNEPPESPRRLNKEFEHYVEVEKDQWMSFVVGPSNEDFVPIEQISPYVIKSIMSTEDSAFYHHRGFIVSEFRTALVHNLKAGRFKFGASSITMQFVKNVLLYREKTLARKLQELFLTWHVENTLSKDRIMEIYLNVIEYGPGLYGIGPASWHFFSKPPKDLNPVEAAFFSTILPSPKERYKQYCAGTLTKWTTGKIQRILAIMLKRERLTQVEYDQAMATPLLFAKDDSESEDECKRRVTKAIKNARPTNPLKR